MTNKKKQNKSGVTRPQLALIGVLTAVLAIVIVVQLPDAPATSPPGAASEPSNEGESDTETNENEIKNASAEEGAEQRSQREWPRYTRAQLVRLDPLSTPDWYNSILEVVEKTDNSNVVTETAHDLQLEELQETGTGIVVIAGSERIAKVGDTHIRVGDKIDGYEVSNITSQGVILTKSKSR